MQSTSVPGGEATRKPGGFRFLPHLLILAVVGLVWGHTTRFGFVWDDRYFIEELSSIRSLKNVPRMFTTVDAQSSYPEGFKVILRPLRTVVYAVLFQIGGGEPPRAWLYHLCNVLWHGAAALLLYSVALRFLRRPPDTGPAGPTASIPALLIALAFAVNPVVSEVVCWAKSLDDIMATVFTLAALRALLGPQLDRRAYALALGWFVLAVYSKISAVPFGIFCFFLFRFWHQFPVRRAARLAFGFLVVGGFFVLHKRLVTGRTSQVDPISGTYLQTLIDMLPVVTKYVRLLCGIPPFCIDYSDLKGGHALASLPVLTGLGLLLALLAFAGWALRRPGWRLTALGLVWTGLFLLPVSNLVPMMQYLAERFLYLPLVGWLLALGAWVAATGRKTFCLVFGVVIVTWMGLAWDRSLIWRDNVTLFVTSYQAAPGPGRVQDNAVAALFKLPALKALFRPSGRDSTQYVVAGNGETTPAQWLAARETLLGAVRLVPRDDRLLSAAGVACANCQDGEGAVRCFQAAAELCPDQPRNWANLGRALSDAGRLEEAQEALRRALRLEPTHLPALHSLAAVYWNKNEFAAASRVWEQLAQLEPDNAENRDWLKRAQAEQKGL